MTATAWFRWVSSSAVARESDDLPDAGGPAIAISARRKGTVSPSILSAISLEFCVIVTNGSCQIRPALPGT